MANASYCFRRSPFVQTHASSLSSLDLSGCRAAMRRPLQLEQLFQRCAIRLRHLDLSGTEVPGAVLGAVLLSCTQLTSLLLDR